MALIRDEIAKNLLYYRKKKNLTQKQLADMLGVKNTAVSNWENGLNSIDVEMLYKACKVLGITFHEIYGVYAADLADELSAHERAVIQAYRDNPQMQPAVDKLLGVDSPKAKTDVDKNETSEETEK